jgi:hypothetical protein
VSLTGKLVEGVAYASDGIAAHGKPRHRIWALVLDAPIHLYPSEKGAAPIETTRVQVNAKLASDKDKWSGEPLSGKRVVVQGSLAVPDRPHEVEKVVFSWLDGPPTVSPAP